MLAPRIEVGIDARTLLPAAPHPERPEPRPTAILTTRVERLVRQLERHSTRIERSERVLVAPFARSAAAGDGARPSIAAVVEPPPRRTPVRAGSVAGPSAAPAAPAPATAPAPAPAAPWRPADAAGLADRVLLELDRRIVAERERRGSLA